MAGTVGERLASMSTLDLYANLRLAMEGDGDFQGVVPTARLLDQMESEWRERPLQDRLVAEARMDAILHEGP
jgi:hypothetical protein